MKRLRAGAILTEFAMYPDGYCPNDLKCMRHTIDALETHSHSYLGWEYASIWNGTVFNDNVIFEMARPFPMAVGGTVDGYAFDFTSRTFDLNFTVAAGASADASSTVIFASIGLYFPSGFSATLVDAPADAVHTIELPCWAGKGWGGSTVSPPAMNCAPATPTPTLGAPAPYAFGYVVLNLTSQTGGRVTLRISPLASRDVRGAPSRVVDTHVHITSLTNGLTYPWSVPPTPPMTCPCVFPSGTPCACEWSSEVYAAASAGRPADAFVFVEVAAEPSQWLAEAQWVQSLADAGDARIRGIVAGAPPGFGVVGANITAIAAELDELVAVPLARGIRAASLNFSDAGAMGTFISHAALLASRGLSLDVITPVAAPGVGGAIAQLAASIPSLTVILDHIGSPNVTGDFDAWSTGLAAVGAAPNVFVKFGGLLQYFKKTGVIPSAAQTTPYLSRVLDVFGWERVLFEGNWFFCNWPGNLDVFADWLPLLDSAVDGAAPTDAQLDALYAGNAAKAYRVQL